MHRSPCQPPRFVHQDQACRGVRRLHWPQSRQAREVEHAEAGRLVSQLVRIMKPASSVLPYTDFISNQGDGPRRFRFPADVLHKSSRRRLRVAALWASSRRCGSSYKTMRTLRAAGQHSFCARPSQLSSWGPDALNRAVGLGISINATTPTPIVSVSRYERRRLSSRETAGGATKSYVAKPKSGRSAQHAAQGTVIWYQGRRDVIHGRRSDHCGGETGCFASSVSTASRTALRSASVRFSSSSTFRCRIRLAVSCSGSLQSLNTFLMSDLTELKLVSRILVAGVAFVVFGDRCTGPGCAFSPQDRCGRPFQRARRRANGLPDSIRILQLHEFSQIADSFLADLPQHPIGMTGNSLALLFDQLGLRVAFDIGAGPVLVEGFTSALSDQPQTHRALADIDQQFGAPECCHRFLEVCRNIIPYDGAAANERSTAGHGRLQGRPVRAAGPSDNG